MQHSSIISHIAIDALPDGGVRATIVAPEKATAGSTIAVSQFLNLQDGVRATPGFSGKQHMHVLHVEGLRDTDQLPALLGAPFAQWQQKQGIAPPVILADNVEITDTDTMDMRPYSQGIDRFIKDHASQLASLGYAAGNIAILASSLAGAKQPGGEIDWLKMTSAHAYNLSSALLLLFASGADNVVDAQTVVEDVYANIGNDAYSAQGMPPQNVMQRAVQVMKDHPWEIASGISATGALAYLGSAVGTLSMDNPSSMINFAAGLGTLTAMGLVSFAPDVATPLTDNTYYDRHPPSLLSTAELLQDHSDKGLLTRILQHPLLVAAGFQTAANISYGISAVTATPRDPFMLAASASYLTGGAIQTQANKHRRASFDDVVRAAVDVIRADPALKHETDVEARIDALSDALTKEADILYTPEALSRGMQARLAREADNPFIIEEWDVMKDSPFIDAPATAQRFVDRYRAESPDGRQILR